MRFLFYTHSLVSDWNHGNAHFLRGVMRDLVARGHRALALEPEDGWSRRNLLADRGPAALGRFAADFPELQAKTYGPAFDHEAALADADVVIVHEWTDPALIARIGRARREGGRFTLLFHDTHHRAVSATSDIADLELADYDGVLAFGATLAERYRGRGWGRSVFVWHEAADDRLFRPHPEIPRTANLIWVGNWGDEERSAELMEFLVEPMRRLRFTADIYGVRYPDDALATIEAAGIRFRGSIANAEVPAAFAAHRVTVHVPRRPYVTSLPGIPTIRVFEALACGIPLVSAPWEDSENLFRPGRDFLVARDGAEMTELLQLVLADAGLAASLAESGLETIRTRHSCRHRVDELFAVLAEIGTAPVQEALSVREAAQ
jgi:spore maturation protein CgeB